MCPTPDPGSHFPTLLERVVDSGGWLNVLDPSFNLHVREEGLAAA